MTTNLNRDVHPCTGCTSTPYRGVIACPVAGVILNKGRHRRVLRMAPADADAALYRAWKMRWQGAKDADDKAVIRFLMWLVKGRNGERLREKLEPLAPASQIQTLARPIVARPRRSRAIGGNTGAARTSARSGSGRGSNGRTDPSARAPRTKAAQATRRLRA